ncbi:MAG: hypothetical protein CMO01_12465 [Thalassobius sp.]|nr:hypothetical protein [Thalassovita sp.]
MYLAGFKKLQILFFYILLIPISGLSQVLEETTKRIIHFQNGGEEYLYLKELYKYENGNLVELIETKGKDSTLNFINNYSYNSNNNLLKEIVKSNGLHDVLLILKFEYNAYDSLIATKWFHSADTTVNPYKKYIYKFDSLNRKHQDLLLNENGDITYDKRYYYKQGQLNEIVTYEGDRITEKELTKIIEGKVIHITYFLSLNSQELKLRSKKIGNAISGSVEEEYYFDDDERIAETTKFEYNHRNKLEKVTQFQEDNTLKSEHFYFYGQNNKLIREEVWQNEKLFERIIYDYKYLDE